MEPVPEHHDGQKKLELLVTDSEDSEEEKNLRLKGGTLIDLLDVT